MSKRILIRIPNWLGDAVMATAAVDAYHEQHPEDIITLLGSPAMLPVFSSSYNPYNLIPFDKDNKDSGLRGLTRISSMLRDEYYDAGYLLTNSFSSALMMYLGKIPERIGYGGNFRSALLTEAETPLQSNIHQIQQYSYLLNGAEDQIPMPKILVSPEEREKARQVLEHEECLGQNRIGIAIGAAYGPAKQWPLERYRDLAKECVEKLDAMVLIFGGNAEIDAAEQIKHDVGECVVNLAGKTTLRQLFPLIQLCQVVVSNDSGVMHVSVAVKTPVVAIFGSTDPLKTGPLGDNHQVLYKNLPCSPCFERTCRFQHYDCLQKIETQDVFNKVEGLLTLAEAK
jgi:lipopolysaccharide heptosyltransferase II